MQSSAKNMYTPSQRYICSRQLRAEGRRHFTMSSGPAVLWWFLSPLVSQRPSAKSTLTLMIIFSWEPICPSSGNWPQFAQLQPIQDCNNFEPHGKGAKSLLSLISKGLATGGVGMVLSTYKDGASIPGLIKISTSWSYGYFGEQARTRDYPKCAKYFCTLRKRKC